MRGLIKISVLVVLGLVIVLPLFLGGLIRYIPDGFQPSSDKVIQVNFESSVSQLFKPTKNNLAMIGLSIKNPNLLNKDDLFFNIYEGAQILRTVEISGKNIPDGDFIKLRFTPILDSLGKTYRMVFSAPSTRANPVGIVASNQSKDQNEYLLVNNDPVGGQIALVAYYKVPNPLVNSFRIYGNLFSQLGKDMPFGLIYGGLITGLIVLVII